MDKLLNLLTKEEIATLKLRALYAENGYSQYKMSKFEEYDLYAKNKDFLVSQNVITFTDTDGKLMALKPDVTLSIIKNTKDFNTLNKVYYNENVYRLSKGTGVFKEIMQVGVECLGEVTNKEVIEVLKLAALSLDTISTSNVLEISNLDVITGVLDAFNLSLAEKKAVAKFLGEKNLQGLKNYLSTLSLSSEGIKIICKLLTIYGSIDKVINDLNELKIDENVSKSLSDFIEILLGLKSQGVSDKICVDFSVVSHMKYYSGVAFKGYVEGIPTSILSGGQYDKLLLRMKKPSKAIGFAVYLDEINKLS